MKYLVFLVLSVISYINLCGQAASNTTFATLEQTFRTKLDSVKTIDNDSAKLIAYSNLQNELVDFLKIPETYTLPFDSLKTVGKVKSPDDAFRIFSWNTLINNDSFKNFAIIQQKPEKGKPCHVFVLSDNSEIDQVENTILRHNNWYGALYYKIIPVKINNLNFYTLLGLDNHSPFVSKKVIDVLYFNNDEVLLGAPIFNVKGKPANRMVFSYSARLSMMLNYDETLKTIVFDHLSPSETRYTGQYEFYGPDFSFDGFVFDKKQWNYVEDIKPNRPTQNNSKPKKGSNNLKGK